MWKRVKGYEDYIINRKDVIISSNGVRLSQTKNNKGYYWVHIGKSKKRELVHRLVALTFIPNPNNYPCVNHIDEDIENNNDYNLEWCTVKYNNNYGTVNQRRKKIELDKCPLNYYSDKPVQRASFQRACKRRGLKFEDFIEIKSGVYKKPDGRNQSLYTYIPKEVVSQ